MTPVSVRVPGSKSMTQRGLVIGALSRRPVRLRGALDCDDSAHLSRALASLGAEVRWDGDQVVVEPGELRGRGQVLACGNGGTALRFAACLSLVANGSITLDGDARMRQRPIGPLGSALRDLGVAVEYGGQEGYPPITVQRVGEPPACVDIDAAASSQFASGLLLVAPRLRLGLTVRMVGGLVSAPYVAMTTTMMSRAGAVVRWTSETSVRVAPGGYFPDPCDAVIDIEPDWSSASFLLAAGFVLDRDVIVEELPEPSRSCQGDAAFAALLEELRRPRAHDIDLSASPDLIAPLAAACLFASERTRIRGVAHARIKESDRIAVLAQELRKLGARIEEHPDGLGLAPIDASAGVAAELDPHGDHRMAMAFGVLSLRMPGIRVHDMRCVSKSFPSFWAQLERVRSRGA